MGVQGFEELAEHVGHATEVVSYGPSAQPLNAAVECLDCCLVLLDFDRDPEAVRTPGQRGEQGR